MSDSTLRRCKVQCYLHYDGVGGGPISTKKRYVTLEWPLTSHFIYTFKRALLAKKTILFIHSQGIEVHEDSSAL